MQQILAHTAEEAFGKRRMAESAGDNQVRPLPVNTREEGVGDVRVVDIRPRENLRTYSVPV